MIDLDILLPFFVDAPEKPYEQWSIFKRLKPMPLNPFTRVDNLELGQKRKNAGAGQKKPACPREKTEEGQESNNIPRVNSWQD